MSKSSEDVDRIWALVEKVSVAMVVTHNGHGEQMRARPMAARPMRDENAIYFLTDADAPKGREVDRSAEVCLAFSDTKSKKYLSITGRADILDDRAKVTRLWSAFDKAFWKDENDPRIRLLRVRPENAQYWESDGAVTALVKLVAADFFGQRKELDASKKVDLNA